MKYSTTKIVTGIFIAILIWEIFISLLFMTLSNSTSATTDISKYQRILSFSGYSKNEVIQYFPKTIPTEAKDVKFFYRPPYQLQAREFALKFTIDKASIEQDLNVFAKKATWTGTPEEARKLISGVETMNFSMLGDEYSNLSSDYQVYIIDNKRYHISHGEISLAAINIKNDTIIFYGENW